MRWLLITLCLLVASARVARADDVLFYWVDPKGVVHATQNIDEVPEPYGAMYRARLKELEEEKKKPKAAEPPAESYTPPPVAPKPTYADAENARQKQWRAEIAKWRTELRVATEDLQRIQTELDNTTLNPILRTTPQVQAQIGPLEERRQKALQRVAIAKKQLTEDLPARAKKENVPPRWWD